MIEYFVEKNKDRLSLSKKDSNNKKWYKEMCDLLDVHALGDTSFTSFGGISEFRRKKVNYDLFNNRVNLKEFEYVCRPYGAQVGELPARLSNRDIVSTKIKVLLGMEMNMPFTWKVVAVNEEATTRREEEEFGRIKKFVTNEIMQPIRMQIEKQMAEQTKGKQLTPDEEKQLQADIQAQTQAQTPDQVKKYMAREHQDPAEEMMHQILQYLIQEKRVAEKFNKGFKHLNLSGTEVYHVGIFNGEPDLEVVNSLYFYHDMSPDLDYIEDGEWAVHEKRLTPSAVIGLLGADLTEREIDRIYSAISGGSSLNEADWSFDEDQIHDAFTLKVLHCTWKSLMKVGFLTYMDQQGTPQMKLVDENYKIDYANGDVKIEWEWIPHAYECYKVLDDIYAFARPVPGQYVDLDNLYKCKLPYYGAVCDNLNSAPTSPMDRMKSYQYFHNVLLYRVELLMASDKGKILAANINAIPKSAGIDVNKFLYFMEANKIAWFNPNEEGNRGSDVTNMVKEIDMSLVSDINKYMQWADYIDRKCGACIGVTPQMEAQIAQGDAVSNTRQNLVQASYIIRPYFELHNAVKGNVLTALVEKAKIAYSTSRPRKLAYIVDDMTLNMLNIDQDLLDGSQYGLFIANSSKAEEAKQAVINLSQAALQNQQIDLSDIIKVIRAESIAEAEELLEVSQQNKQEQLQATDKAKMEQDAKTIQENRDFEREKWQHESDMIVLKEKERRKTEIGKQTVLSLGFNEDKDMDNDGQPDVIEVANHVLEGQKHEDEMNLENRKLDHQVSDDAEKNRLQQEKLRIDAIKAKNKPSK